MKVQPRRLAYCFDCDADTVQWLTEIRIPRSRGCFANRSPIEEYTCSQCGTEQV